MSALVLPKPITPAVAEDIHRRSGTFARSNDLGAAERGVRMAQARAPLFLMALERVAETVGQMAEHQYGRTRRSTKEFSHQVESTEAQVWREAYRLADAGIPDIQFGYYYAAVAEFLDG